MRAQSSLPVSSVYGFGVWGAARSHDQKVKRLQNLRGGPHAVAAPANLTDLLGARAERVPDCSSYLSHSSECNRQWVVSPPAQLCGSRGG